MMKFFTKLILAVIISFFWMSIVQAGDLTLPLASTSTNSFFDHQPPFDCFNDCGTNDNFIKYNGDTYSNSQANFGNCSLGSNCYNGHAGIDFQASSGTSVIAAVSGVVQVTGYMSGYGNYVRLWHQSLGYSTFYAHLSNITTSSGSVSRGTEIGKSGASGGNWSPHLHFGVYDAQTGGNPIDPYGWSGSGSDPWTYDLGYLWTTNPPSHYANSNPTSPNLSSPSNNSTVGSLGVNFVWYGATDPDGDSPLDYSLVVKDNGGTTVLETQWLESTYSYSYTLPSNGNYTWFVKVGDRHGGQNQSSTWNLTISVPSPTISLSASRTYTQAGKQYFGAKYAIIMHFTIM